VLLLVESPRSQTIYPQYAFKVESGHSHKIRIKIFQIIYGSSRLIRRTFFLSKRTQKILKNAEYFKKVINIHNIDSNIKTCILFNELEHKGTKYKLSYYVITQNWLVHMCSIISCLSYIEDFFYFNETIKSTLEIEICYSFEQFWILNIY